MTKPFVPTSRSKPVSAAELKSTTLLGMRMDEASAKGTRTPDKLADLSHLGLSWQTGTVGAPWRHCPGLEIGVE
jgi:hypothetical protein